MKKIAIFTVLISLLSCENKSEYTKKKFAVIKDANVIPTSFNEQMKIQVKTDKQFFVVGSANGKLPQLTFGDSLTGLFSKHILMYIIDNRGEKFKVK